MHRQIGASRISRAHGEDRRSPLPVSQVRIVSVNTNLPTSVCAWCTKVIHPGTREISHGICHACARALVATFEASPPAA